MSRWTPVICCPFSFFFRCTDIYIQPIYQYTMPTSTMPPHRMLENENQTSDVGGNGEAVVRHVLLLFICHLIFSHCWTHTSTVLLWSKHATTIPHFLPQCLPRTRFIRQLLNMQRIRTDLLCRGIITVFTCQKNVCKAETSRSMLFS